MRTRLSDRADQALSDRKVRDQATILPFAGLILLLPPVAGIFFIDAKVAGVPFTLLYVFSVWALLIAGAAMLAQRLREHDDSATRSQNGARATPEPDLRQGPDD